MAVTITQLIHIIMVGAIAIAMFGFLSMVVSGVSGDGFACRLSVTLVSLNIADRINCRVAEVEIPDRVVDRDGTNRFLAEEMLACWAIFGSGNINQLRSQDLVDRQSIVPRALAGHLPDGRLFRGAQFWERHSFCHVCSIVTLPELESTQGLIDDLSLERYRGVSFAEHLYPVAAARDLYLNKNSDALLPSDSGPATALVFYTEGRYNGQDLNGVVLMSSSDFAGMFDNQDDSDSNFCQRYLS